MRGKFITVEGIEGVGKSTNVNFLSSIIEAKGFSVLRTREPGGTPMAERIRHMLLAHDEEPLPDIAELLLFFAARALHVNNTIQPALAAGTWVVCDRFTDASLAYQGHGRGLGLERINLMADWVHKDLQPDLTLLLDAPPEIAMDRAEKRGEADRLDSEETDFYQRVRDGYLDLAASEPERIAVLDASQDLAQVQAAIAVEINRLVEHNKN